MAVEILNYSVVNGLVMCDDPGKALNNSELFYLHKVSELSATAVLFRRFFRNKGESPDSSTPAVCIFERAPSFFNSDEHLKLHAALWSEGLIEVYIVLCGSRIDIVNARKPAGITSEKLDLRDLILLSEEAVQSFSDSRFSSYHFQNGTFWEQEDFTNHLSEKNSPYIYLTDYLMGVRSYFLKSPDFPLSASIIDRLLVISILVKFLEEIRDDNGKHTLRENFAGYDTANFAEAIEKGLLTAILDDLGAEFNGEIFNQFTNEEKAQIDETDLSLLAGFLRADVDIRTGQKFLWEQFSFAHLPTEVISAIYENFIQAESIRISGERERGVVYTPIHLVNFLVDEVMPLQNSFLFSDERFRVLDPSCGSGVFLVAAYKRLLQWWAIENRKDGMIQYPDHHKAPGNSRKQHIWH